MRRLHSLLLWPCLLLLLGLSPDAGATTLLRTELPELTQGSDVVVQGRVRHMESRWSADGRRILTDVHLEVTDALKGTPGAIVTLTQPGGRVGDIAQRVDGLASFTPGEEVVVFLQQGGAERFVLRGMAQGKYSVKREGAGREPLAVPEAVGEALLIDGKTGQSTSVRSQTLTLAQLKQRVRSALQSPRQAK